MVITPPGYLRLRVVYFARRGVPFEAHYCAAKAACSRFLEALQLERQSRRPPALRVQIYPLSSNRIFRGKADWHGLTAPANPAEGSDPALVARPIMSLMERTSDFARVGYPGNGPSISPTASAQR